ncbi:MAG: hypothetical protein M1838_003387 [Thelocarpon superellum]|nr:MAG: hypothetical protein M1838_003387 [Thelocarpon superellum]
MASTAAREQETPGDVGQMNGETVAFGPISADTPKPWSLTWTGQTAGQIDEREIIAVVDRQPPQERDVFYLSSSPSDEQNTPRFARATASGLPLPLLHEHHVAQLPPHLLLAPSPAHGANVHIFISTTSGTGKAVDFFSAILQPTFSALNLSPSRYTVHKSESAQSLIAFSTSILLPRALQGTPQTVVLLSGDGGVHDIINALFSSPTPPASTPIYTPPTLALLALGTGNALSHSLHLTQDTNTLGLRALLHGTPRPLPLFRARFSTGACILTDEERSSIPIPAADHVIRGAVVLSFGLHASLVGDSDTTAYRQLGAQRFQQAAKDLLFPSDGSQAHTYRATLTITPSASPRTPTTLTETTHSYILATLVSNLEKTFTVSPLSTPLSPSLRLLRIPPLSGADLMKIFTLAYDHGAHVTHPSVSYEEVAALRIVLDADDVEAEKWRRVCVDGTIVRLEPGGWVELGMEQGRVVDVVVPKDL